MLNYARYFFGMLGLLMLFIPPAEASEVCDPIEIERFPGSLTLLGIPYGGEVNSTGAPSTSGKAALGVQAHNIPRYWFGASDWDLIVSDFGFSGMSANNAYIYKIVVQTSKPVDDGNLTAADMVGVSFFGRKNGALQHRMYRPDGSGGFVEDSSVTVNQGGPMLLEAHTMLSIYAHWHNAGQQHDLFAPPYRLAPVFGCCGQSESRLCA